MTFGAEPKDYEVQEFIQKNYYSLRFTRKGKLKIADEIVKTRNFYFIITRNFKFGRCDMGQIANQMALEIFFKMKEKIKKKREEKKKIRQEKNKTRKNKGR